MVQLSILPVFHANVTILHYVVLVLVDVLNASRLMKKNGENKIRSALETDIKNLKKRFEEGVQKNFSFI